MTVKELKRIHLYWQLKSKPVKVYKLQPVLRKPTLAEKAKRQWLSLGRQWCNTTCRVRAERPDKGWAQRNGFINTGLNPKWVERRWCCEKNVAQSYKDFSSKVAV